MKNARVFDEEAKVVDEKNVGLLMKITKVFDEKSWVFDGKTWGFR